MRRYSLSDATNKALTPQYCYATVCRHALGSDDGPRYGQHYGHATDLTVILSYPIINPETQTLWLMAEGQ